MDRRRFIFLLLPAVLVALLAGCRTIRENEITQPPPETVATAPTAEATTVCTTVPTEEPLPTEAETVPIEAETVPTEAVTEPPVDEFMEETVFSVSLDTDGLPYLTWGQVAEAYRYKVYRTVDKKLESTVIISTSKTSYTDTDAPRGLTLYYRVTGLDAHGQVCYTSPTVSAATAAPEMESLETRYVSIPKLRIYELPHPDSRSVALRYMDELLLGAEAAPCESGIWYRVYHYDKLYYLLIEDGALPLTPRMSSFRYHGNTQLQQQVIDLSLDICNNWKTHYLSGGSGWLNSEGAYEFSCSGLVAYILNTVMRKDVPVYNLPAKIKNLYAVEEIYNIGYPGELRVTKITMDELQPGDVLFFASQSDGTASDEIGHCGLYLGNGEFVHSTSAWKDSVCIMPLAGAFLENLRVIRRYLPETPDPANTVKTIDGQYRYYKVYARQSSNSTVISTPAQGDTLNVLYTSGSWAYVETNDGKVGYFPVKHFR